MAIPSSAFRVGLVCDTHVGDVLPNLPEQVVDALAGVDLIIHAGDIAAQPVLDRLGQVAPLVAVRGNHDRMLTHLPTDLVVTVGGVRIGVTHGRRNPAVEVLFGAVGLLLGRPVTWGLGRALRRRVGAVDCLVFGHYHLPFRQQVSGTEVLSPGAVYVVDMDDAAVVSGLRGLAFRRFRRGLPATARVPAVGILHVSDGQVGFERVTLRGPLRTTASGPASRRKPQSS